MQLNTSMWIKALRVIPRISKEEWNQLDVISRWLIASRAAVFVMTALAGAIGGLMAYRDGYFSLSFFLLAIAGIVLAHATNNMLNDYVDYSRGVDKNNYYRALYGPQPLEHGLLSKSSFINYIMITGLLAVAIGVYLVYTGGPSTWWLFGLGLFFLLFYTWPLKYYGLGEPAVVVVWGPLMVGGTYYVVSGGHWDSAVLLLSLVYSLGPTTVLLGKHTDKLSEDQAKGIGTVPVLIGEKAARYATIVLWIAQYAFILYLVATRELGWPVLLILLAIPTLWKAIKVSAKPRPETAPAGKLGESWPLYLVHNAFTYNRSFSSLFLLGLLAEVLLHKFL